MRGLSTRAALALIVFLALFYQTDAPLGKRPIERIAEPYSYNLLAWEVRNLPSKWLNLVRQWLRGDAPSEREQVRVVQRYFILNGEIAAVEGKLTRLVALSGGAEVEDGELLGQLGRLERERDGLKGQVEAALESQITKVLEDLGLERVLPFPRLRLVFPPVDFALQRPPSVLIVSPRDRIEMIKGITLQPALSAREGQTVEAKVEAMGLSAIVEATGGFATYPTSIPANYPLRLTLEAAAHEWLHTYLAFEPLGRSYSRSEELRSINETVANMAGDEIGWMVFKRYYQPDAPSPSDLRARQTKRDNPTDGFNFAAEMRVTRLVVDGLLSEGKVEEAESFMAERQRLLAEHGYYIRKLNQAYFAFHGAYADTPQSANPIGQALLSLRERSGSIREFLNRVKRFSRPGDLEKALSGY